MIKKRPFLGITHYQKLNVYTNCTLPVLRMSNCGAGEMTELWLRSRQSLMKKWTFSRQKRVIKIFYCRFVGKTGNLLECMLYGLEAVIHYSCG